MNLAQAIDALAAAGTEQNRKVYRRHGAKGELFGVGFASLDALAASIGPDHALARKLWASKKPDARLLATRVADARRIKPAELDEWAADLDWYVAADALAKLAFHTPHAKKLALAWIDSKKEWIARAGWHTLALLTRDKSLPDAFFEPMIARIEANIHRAPNRTRDAMNAALIAIGIRSAAFAKACTQAAKRIGKVEVDHGSPSLKTPDAATYIRRARAWLERATAARPKTTRKSKKPALAAKNARAAKPRAAVKKKAAKRAKTRAKRAR